MKLQTLQALVARNALRDLLTDIRVNGILPSATIYVLRRHDLPLTPTASALIQWGRHHATRHLRQGA